MKRLLVLNGPNLNLLGTREVNLYGNGTYGDLVEHCLREGGKCGVQIDVRQTNHEGVLVDWIQEAKGVYDGIVLNAAAYTHTSVAILDALKAVALPAVEVHLTEPLLREEFRKVSFVSMAAEKTFSGMGFESYSAAISYLASKEVV